MKEKPTEVAAVDPDKTAKDPKKSTSSSSSSKKTDTKVEAKDEPKEEPKKAEPKGDNIDRLLDQIDNGSQKEPKKTVAAKKESEPSSSSGGGKDKLDKSDVLNTIKAYSGRVNTCYKSQNSNNLKGTMKVKFAIKPNGGVTNVEVVDGTFAGTDVGRCVQKAVGGPKFPVTTAKDNVPVTYPFKLE
ncbi:MAG: AgmX/PglI C-terminal domain-containing protein [bacterium]